MKPMFPRGNRADNVKQQMSWRQMPLKAKIATALTIM